jgi:hypothetical protein
VNVLLIKNSCFVHYFIVVWLLQRHISW